VLLIFSHLVRRNILEEKSSIAGKKLVSVKAAGNSAPIDREVKIAYRQFSPTSRDSLPVLVLLHGSPMGSESFDDLGPELGKEFRALVPDLPGFGASTAKIPDYSIRAHAEYVLQFMDQLHVSSAHLVGYSMGGGVALNLIDLAPERVASITMLSAIGVQEFELLGDYHLNHAIHGVQLGLLWLLQEAVPHFGLVDKSMLNVRYARNFYDTDQRPLREYLLRYENPMLIQHGVQDGLVPVAVALEHHRLVPQSVLKKYDAGHGMAFTRWQEIGNDIKTFVREVVRGKATTRMTADSIRIAAAASPFDAGNIPPPQGITLFIILLLIAAATLVSEDLACIGTGLMIARGTIGFVPGTLACFSGIYFGDLLLFWAGKVLGRPAISAIPLKWLIKKEDVQRSTDWFAAKGPKIIFASRFLPGSRLPTYFTAGLLRTNFWRFSFYFFVAAAAWTPLVVGVATVVGEMAFELFSAYQKYALVSVVGSAVVMYACLELVVPLFSYKGRRLLLSAIRRKTRWEFWPLWLFYPPIVIYAIYLGIKYRSLTLFTAANPAIPESGFIGESKYEILQGLSAAKECVARHVLIKNHTPASERWRQARQFIRENELSLPIVMKPDKGQRGAGVVIARSEPEIEKRLSHFDFDVILQEYVPGSEFGVFYVRYPNQEKGFIYSITDKRFPTVAGDGKHTLEELILADERAVCMAPLHLKKHENNLRRVPAKDERIKLVELGTHCRGALFLDGNNVKTQALEAAIDDVSKSFTGFYFGRYDIRTPSVEDFKKGKNFKIVELNGVTSEATHIYDPANGLLSAYRVLMKQWRMAFEIGEQNRRAGVKPVSVRKLLSSLFAHRK
jgi:pimeloyl-ACP methyl ester carboxylesterase/membrane protein DedA with SNARE-associated domain